MIPLGLTSEEEAAKFIAAHPLAQFGSKSSDRRRRLVTDATGPELAMLQLAFSELATATAAEDARIDSERCPPCQQRAIGDRLAEIIKGHRPNETPCADCMAEIERLNNMTPEQVVAEAKEIAMRIVQRASVNASSPIDRLIATALPSIPTAVVSGWIMEAVQGSAEQ